jgi:ribosomal-protein-alanine N-acetyltransferase
VVRIALETPRLTLRAVCAEDGPELLAYHERNREHLRPWEPDPPPLFYTLGYWERFASGASDESSLASRVRLLAFAPDAPSIVASVNRQSIERGVAQRTVLGYSIDGASQGRGLAREAVSAAVAFAFDTLRLHRIEANYQPSNERSAKLLRALDFTIEGYAREYLFLAGAWRDHVLTSRTNPTYGVS